MESLHWTDVSGRSLLEWTEYDDIALWWFVHNDFQMWQDRTGTGERRGGSRSSFPLDGGSLSESARLLYQVFAFVVGRLLSGSPPPRETRRDRVLIISQNNQWREIRDPKDGRLRTGDAFFDSIIEELDGRGQYDIVTAYPLMDAPVTWQDPFRNLLTVLRRRREAKFPHRVIDSAWSVAAWRAARKARTYFRSLWPPKLGLDPLLKQISEEGGTDEVLDRLGYYFHTIFGRVIGLRWTTRRLLETERPRLIVLINEYGRFERTLVVAARLLGVPVLAIQHGVIHRTHPGYMYSSQEISEGGSVNAPFCPIPDVTAVYGPYHKELLTEVSAYPSETVVVTGQPRYDRLADTGDWRDRDQVLGALRLDPAQRTVLWATQTHGLPLEENRRNVAAVFGALTKLEATQLIIKLHPNEDQRATLYREGGSGAPVIVGREGDTLALVNACDLLITRHSTVAMEAVALNRPVIILNLSGQPDPVEYVEEGVAVGVYRGDDLLGAIRQILASDASLVANRKRYIERNLYRVDGKATERVVDLIDSMMERARART